MGLSGQNRYDATREVRFAVVLYGGVSLAIYMNGIVQELLQLVRSTAPEPDGNSGRLWWGDDDLQGAASVYRKLGCLLVDGGLQLDGVSIDEGTTPTPTVVLPGGRPVKTRLVVDIVTGTSAGGINGVFLAKALAMDRDISSLSSLWVEQGDIGKLLNDAQAMEETPGLDPQRPPRSLLSGPRMLYQLLKALEAVTEAVPSRKDVPNTKQSPYADEIDLWVTATDLEGRPVSVETWNPERLGAIREANNHTTFHFHYDVTDIRADSGKNSAPHTFAGRYDPMLAFAARCTSSFPGAFEAVKLTDLATVMAARTGVEALRAGKAADDGWAALSGINPFVVPRGWAPLHGLDKFFTEYGGAQQAALHSFADGGYLDNQPVDLVMRTLPKRRSQLPVARRVLVVDPDPGTAPRYETDGGPDAIPVVPLLGDRADLLSTIVKVVTLPRIQTIGGDVERILALREPCRVREAVYKALNEQLDRDSAAAKPSSGGAGSAEEAGAATREQAATLSALDAGSEGSAAATGVGDEAGEAQPGLGSDDDAGASLTDTAYEMLRRAILARELGAALARVGFPERSYPAGSQHHAIATRIVAAWHDRVSPATHTPGSNDPVLDELDLGFELRRINFLQGQIDRLMRESPQDRPTFGWLRHLRAQLDERYVDAARQARHLRNRAAVQEDQGVSATIDKLRTALTCTIKVVPFDGPPEQADAELGKLLAGGQPLRDALDGVRAVFAKYLNLAEVRRTTLQTLSTDNATGDPPEAAQRRNRLVGQWNCFAAYDEATLALREMLAGENNDIEVLRVSPQDTWRLVDERIHGPKLAGVQVHHFGGFLSADWRRNDILWGRLDAAERLIAALCPTPPEDAPRDPNGGLDPRDVRDCLIGEAHAAIIGDVLRDSHYRSLLGTQLGVELSPDPPQGSSEAAKDVRTVLDAFRAGYQRPGPPPRQESVEVAARAARVFDKVGGGLPIPAGPLTALRRWIGATVRVAAGLAEVAVPDPKKPSALVTRHLLAVAAIAGVLMIILGGIVGGPAVVSFGWVVVVVAIAARLIVALVAAWIAGDLSRIWIVVALVVVVGLIGYALYAWDGWSRALALAAVAFAIGVLLGTAPGIVRARRAKEAAARLRKQAQEADVARRKGDPGADGTISELSARMTAEDAKARHVSAGRVTAVILAAAISLGVAGSGIGAARERLAEKACELDESWYRTFTTRVLLTSCASTSLGQASTPALVRAGEHGPVAETT
jgi:patatin-related protein